MSGREHRAKAGSALNVVQDGRARSPALDAQEVDATSCRRNAHRHVEVVSQAVFVPFADRAQHRPPNKFSISPKLHESTDVSPKLLHAAVEPVLNKPEARERRVAEARVVCAKQLAGEGRVVAREAAQGWAW